MSSSESSSSDSSGRARHKKRVKNVDEWKCNIRKRARLAGESYTSTTGKVIGAKTTGASCQ